MSKIESFEDLLVWQESMDLITQSQLIELTEKAKKISLMLYKLIKTRKQNFS